MLISCPFSFSSISSTFLPFPSFSLHLDRFKQQFIDKRLSMLKAEADDKKEDDEKKIVELPEGEEETAAAKPAEKAAAAAVDDDDDAAVAATASMMEGLEVMDVEAKKRGESEEREIKEAKKIVETLIPESTKLAGIKEVVGGVGGGECGGCCKPTTTEEKECEKKKEDADNDAAAAAKDGAAGAASSATTDPASPTSTTKDDNDADDDDASFERLSKDIVKRSARAVKSLKDNEFDIRFNPDIFQTGVRHAATEEDLETYEKEKQLIKDAADFLLAYQVK